jgi:nitrogen fixation protein FixH
MRQRMSNDFFADHANAFTPLDRGTGKQSPTGQLTGWMVFGLIVAFFAVIFGVNAYMAHMAISTFGGVETESSYHAGQTFERDVAMAKAQDQQHWQVDVNVTTAADGGAVLDIVARDAAGAPLTGLLDRNLAVSESAPGRFRGNVDIPAGQWDLVIDLSRQGERLFRSKNRVVLH